MKRNEGIDYDDKRNYPDYIERIHELIIPAKQSPERLDRYISRVIMNATRAKVQSAIEAGNVTVNGEPQKPSYKIRPHDKIRVVLMKPPPIELLPEDLNLDIVFEDEYLLIVNKPAGMCTHPGMGNRFGTLVNGVLYHFGYRESIPLTSLGLKSDDEDEDGDNDNDEVDNKEEIISGEELSGDETGRIFASKHVRPGIVHRIDKETSGLLVVAKDDVTHAKIAAQFAAHTSEREYISLLWGNPDADEGRIESNIGRSSRDRKLFAVLKNGGKFAITDYTVIERYEIASLVKFKLHTGRTHQIRVHAASINNPVFGDKTYGGDINRYKGYNKRISDLARKCLPLAERQLLHAKTLGFIHPHTNEYVLFDSDIPADMQRVIDVLRKSALA